MDPFDIVVPVGPDDAAVIQKQLMFNMKNVIGYRNVYLICYNRDAVSDKIDITWVERKRVHFIDEHIFPFSKQDVAKFHGHYKRNGWYLQQLLKLYCSFVVPGMLDRYLVIDADTFFIRPTRFVDDENRCLYNYSHENYTPYYHHMKRMCQGFDKVYAHSGICHHMMFEKKYIQELFDCFDERNDTSQMNTSDKLSGFDAFWPRFLYEVDWDLRGDEPWPKSGASEYELYINYMMKNHPGAICERELKYIDIHSHDFLEHPENYPELDYVSWHFRFR
jgi:hypothetical protein